MTNLRLLQISMLIFWVAFLAENLSAQTTTFFSPISLTDGQLTTDQYKVKQSYQSRSNVISVQLIQLPTPTQIQGSTTITLQIPGNSITYTFSATTREVYSNGNFYWYGEVSGVSGISDSELLPDGSLSIVGNTSKVFGEMRIDTKSYSIPYLGDGLNALVIYNQPNNENPGCLDIGTEVIQPPTESGDRALCPVVDVLILYSQAALNSFPDIENIALQAFNNSKQALLNSKVYTEDVDLHLQGIKLLPGFTETGLWPADQAPILAPNSPAQLLRNAYHADLVMILVPPVYTQFWGSIFNRPAGGFSFGDTPADGLTAFAVVEADAANLPNYTFTHEMGHLFGGRHQWADDCEYNDDGSGIQDAHGHSWQKQENWPWGKFYKTVTSACYDNSNRKTILNFSNPDVSYMGRSTGVPGWANNAKTIRNAVCRISNYVTSHDLSAHTDPPINFLCPGNSFGFRGFAVGDFGPYQFQWKYKLGSGGSWIDYTPTGAPENFNFIVPANFFGTIYVELTVTNGVDVATASTYAYSDYLRCSHRPAHQRFNEDFADMTSLSIVPNPANEMIDLKFGKYVTGVLEIVVSNTLGDACFSKTIVLDHTGADHVALTLPELPNGIYVLNLKQSGYPSQVQKFVINR